MPHKHEGMEGFGRMNQKEADALLALIPQEGRVLEIGTFHGVTAAYWATCRPDAIFVSIDPFEDGVGTDAGDAKKWYANAQPNQLVFVGTSLGYLRCGAEPKIFETIVVDGDHGLKWCLTDLMVAAAVLGRNGAILAHDYGFPNAPRIAGVTKAVHIFCRSGQFKVTKTVHRTAVIRRAR